jgi:hypothetical protein
MSPANSREIRAVGEAGPTKRRVLDGSGASDRDSRHPNDHTEKNDIFCLVIKK